MVDSALLETLEHLTPPEQAAIRVFAEYLKSRRASGADPERETAILMAEMASTAPQFTTPDTGLTPARLAARRFMCEHPVLMQLLAR